MKKFLLTVSVYDFNRYQVYSLFKKPCTPSELFEYGIALRREYPDYNIQFSVEDDVSETQNKC